MEISPSYAEVVVAKGSMEIDWEIGLIGGVEKRRIVISPYQSHWAEEFDRHKNVIATALGSIALGIEHIGSTAVPGLAAKPVVDMLLIVRNSANETSYLPKLQRCGYRLRVREPDFHEHRMLRTSERDVHVHVFSESSPLIDRYLLFRDRLRSNDQDRQRYQDLKLRLAAEDWEDMNAYADAKTEMIDTIITAARAERDGA